MRKFIMLFALLVVALTSYCSDTEYVIVRNGETTTLHTINTYDKYTSVYSYTTANMSVQDLKAYGLPKYLWPEVSGESGIFDSRLVAAKAEIADLTLIIDHQTDRISALKEEDSMRSLLSMLLLVIMLVGFTIVYTRKKK